jgi:hypothetical protein
MDDARYATFFLQPTDPMHRRYEVLRAVLVEHRSMQDVAQALGYRYDSVRDLVCRFRRQFDTGQVPPFSPRHAGDVPATTPHLRPHSRTSPRSPTPAPSAWPPGGDYGPAWPASSCSSRCWPVSASTISSAAPAMPARG